MALRREALLKEKLLQLGPLGTGILIGAVTIYFMVAAQKSHDIYIYI